MSNQVAKRFAKAYPVVLLARREESYADLVKEVNSSGGQAFGVPTDVTSSDSVAKTFQTIAAELKDAHLAAAVYNVAAGRSVKPFLDLQLADLDASLKGNAHGLFNFAQATIPLLLKGVEAGGGSYTPSLIVTGTTASMRGSAKFADFAAGKFAARALTQSLAREFGPQGVHVAHAIIDGAIDVPKMAAYKDQITGGKPDAMLSPESVSLLSTELNVMRWMMLTLLKQIADSYFYLHTQHRSAFTQELDLRPYSEKF